MYDFADTTAGAVATVLPAEAVKINGSYIENMITGGASYTTLYVGGRESLAKEIAEYDATKADGAVRKYTRFPSRTLTVGFQLIADDENAFREAFNTLNTILNVDDAVIIIADETDKYFVGTPVFDAELEAGRNNVVGEYQIYCLDPFKYAVEESGPLVVKAAYDTADAEDYSDTKSYVVGDMAKHLDGETMKLYECIAETTGVWDATKWQVVANMAFEMVYDGGYKSYPRLVVDFAQDETGGNIGTRGNSGFVQLAKVIGDRYVRLQFGNDEEEAAIAASGFDLDFTANTLGDFTNQSGSLLTFTDDADAVASESGVSPQYGDGTGWHGSYITAQVTAAGNFELDFSQFISLTNKKQMFGFMAVCLDASDNVVAGVRYTKDNKKDNKGKIEYLIGGETKKSKKQDFSKTGKFGQDKNGVIKDGGSYIKREDGVVAIKLACDSKDEYFYPETVTRITKIGFFFVKKGSNANPSANYLRSAKFSATTVANSFKSGDSLEVDCTKAAVRLNTVDAQSLGDVGNEWSDFYLDVGSNIIFTAWSDWTVLAPTLRLYYRARWI